MGKKESWVSLRLFLSLLAVTGKLIISFIINDYKSWHGLCEYVCVAERQKEIKMRYVISRSIAPALTGIDSLFSDFFSDVSTKKIPPVDIYQTDSSYVIEAEVAGYDDNDIRISVKDGTITISSVESWKERRERAKREKNMISSEIYLPEFSRSFILPDDSDQEAISAESDKGILVITIPRLKKAEKGRIEVKIGK